jgi:hypothetical protein
MGEAILDIHSKKHIMIYVPICSTYAGTLIISSSSITRRNKKCYAFVQCRQTKLQARKRERTNGLFLLAETKMKKNLHNNDK